MLTTDKLCYAWGNKPALQDVSMQVPEGKTIALLGPNGAGKSTLLRCILGQLKPSSGVIALRQCEAEGESRAEVAWVPQTITVYPQLTVRENLQVFARIMGLRGTRQAEAVANTIQVIGLAHRAKDPARALSGGMQRMLNIGMALVSEPRLLLLDEPTAGIDQKARHELHGLLATLKASGMTILLTTHDLEDAARLADRVAILVEGQLRAEGSVQQLVVERFARRRELRVLVQEPIPATLQTMLSDAQLHPVEKGLWRGLHAPGEELDVLLKALISDERHVLDASVRRPSLDLFIQDLLSERETEL